MTIHAELHDGTRLEFPDGTDPNVIDRVVMSETATRAKFAKQGTPAPSLEVPDQGSLKSLAVGAGRKVDKLIAGAKQMYYGATGNQEAQDNLEREQKRNDAGYAPLQRANPTSTGIGESLPGALASIPFTGGGSALGAIGMGALTAAAPEALSYGSPKERLANALKAGAGGAAGAGLGVGLTKLLQPVSNAGRLSDEALKAADSVGVKLTAGQQQQSKSLQALENYLERTPGYAGKMEARSAANQAAINQTASKSIGENATRLGEDVLANAKGRIGGEFDRLSKLANPDAGSATFMDALSKVDATNLARKSYMRPDIAKQVDKGLELAAQGKLSGEAYQAIRSELGSAAQSAHQAGDATLGDALKTIQKGLDGAANESLSVADREAYALARKQYAAFKALTKGQVAEAGNVSPARLASFLRNHQGDAFRTGQSTMDEGLVNIGRLGEAVKGVKNPNSGQLLLSKAMMSNPISALGMAAGNRMMGAALMNPVTQAYLKSNTLSPELAKLLMQGSVPAGIIGSAAYQGSQ